MAVKSMPVMKELFKELGEISKELTNNLETLNKLILARMKSMKESCE